MIAIDEEITSSLLALGRICLAMPFLVSGIHKLGWYRKAVDEFKTYGMPLIAVTLPATIILHLAGSICLVAGVFVAEAAGFLALFTVLATIKVHHFWTMQGEQRLIISRVALANLGVTGGLLMVAVIAA